MKQNGRLRLRDVSKNPDKPLVTVTANDLMPLPSSWANTDHPGTGKLTEDQANRYESSLDGVVAVAIPKPQNKAEEEALIQKFLDGLRSSSRKKTTGHSSSR